MYIFNHMYFLFLPVICLLIIGILMTFRDENIHSQGPKSNETFNRRDTAGTHPDTMRRRVLWDIQVIIISLCFFVASLGHTALEPSLAVWIKSAFGEGSLSTARILGIGGLTTILGSVISAIVVNAFQDRLWVFCIASLCTAGVPLLLLKFSCISLRCSRNSFHLDFHVFHNCKFSVSCIIRTCFCYS